MKKKNLNLFEGVRKELYQERQDWIDAHQDYFIYETDDFKSFDNLDDALKYVNSEKGQDANEIIRRQVVEDEIGDDYEFNNGVTLDDEVVWTREDGRVDEKLLKEGTSNFAPLGKCLPLLVFYTYDEVLDRIDCEEDKPKYDAFESEEDYVEAREDFEQKYIANLHTCVLDETSLDELRDDLDDLNGEIKSLSFDLEDEAEELDHDEKNKDKVNELLEQAGNLRAIKFEIKGGYYEAAQVYTRNSSSFDKLEKRFQNLILNKLKEIKDKYELTELGVSYRFSNGETDYHKVENLNDSFEKPFTQKFEIYKKDKRKTPAPKNTDPKKNMEMFNHMMGSDKYGSDSDGVCADAPCGDSCGESVETKDVVEKFGFEKIKIKYDGSLEDIANCIENLSSVVMAFVEDGEVKVQCAWHSTRRQAHNDYVKVGTELHDYEKKANLSQRLDIKNYSLEWRDGGKECAVKFNVYLRNKIKGLEESKEDPHYTKFDKIVKELDVSDDEIKKVIKIADDYESKAQRGFITYSQMDEVAKAMGLKEMSDSELSRAWNVYYYVLQRESLSDNEGALKEWVKYQDAASAFAEVINREARERKARKEKESQDKDEGMSLKEASGVKDWNKLFLEFLEFVGFGVVKCDETNRKAKSSWGDESEGDWALRDLQGANLGDIEASRFNNADALTDRMEIYIVDYFLEPLEEHDYEGAENNYSCEDWVNWYNTIGKEKYGDELSDWNFDILDMLANHCKDVDLNKVYEMQGKID